MLKIAICDDKINIVKQLREYCEEYSHIRLIRFEIECYTSPNKLIMDSSKFDIFFIDIEMPELSGMKVGKVIREHNISSQIVIVSAYDKYKPIAYGIHPFDYIDKPFDKKTIFNVLDELARYRLAHKEPSPLIIRTNNEIYHLSIYKIIYIEVVNRKTQIHYNLDEIYTLYVTLESLLKELSCHGFIMPHNSFIINYRFIKNYKRYQMELINGKCIPISQNRYKKFDKEIHANILKY